MNYRQTVREIALDQYGYVTTRDAADAGVPVVELRKLAARGALCDPAGHRVGSREARRRRGAPREAGLATHRTRGHGPRRRTVRYWVPADAWPAGRGGLTARLDIG